MRRRDFVKLAGGAATVFPFSSAAQTREVRIGYLGLPPLSEPVLLANWPIFVDALGQLGWVEGQNLRFERRSAEGRNELLPELAAELVALRPNVIVTGVTESTKAVQEKTNTVPIVMTAGPDPVALGFVKSLARPGGNITGVILAGADLYGKVLQILTELRPGMSRVVFYWNPRSPGSRMAKDQTEAAAAQLGLAIELGAVENSTDLETVLANTHTSRPDALIVSGNPQLQAHSRRIAEFAIQHRIPAVSGWTGMTRNGFLMSLSPQTGEMFRRAAAIVDKILRGAKPADIPVEQPTKYSFVINLKTARAIGIEIPAQFLDRADEVIE